MLAVIDALDDLTAVLMWRDGDIHVRMWAPGEYGLRRRLLALGPIIGTTDGPRVSYRIYARGSVPRRAR